MRALTCPKCGAPIHSGASICPYCRVGLEADPAVVSQPQEQPDSQASVQQPLVEIPSDWIRCQDPWHGFSIAHPKGWQVVTTKGQISVREDPSGLTAALIWPYSLQVPASARQVALQFTNMARSYNPTFQAWEQGNSAGDTNRITVRTRQVRWGQPVEGVFNVLVNGANVIVSGYEAPSQAIAQRSAVMAQILSTFRTIDLMPRQRVQEPTEGAYAIWIPSGWNFQGRVDRNHIGGSGSAQFSISRDPQSQVMAASPWMQWNFMDGMGGFMATFTGQTMMRFVPAAQFCTQNVAPWMSQFQQGLTVESVSERMDLCDQAVKDLMEAGYPPGMFESTIAVIETTYTENGVRMRQKSRVATQRQRSAGMFAAATPIWMAFLDVYYRAPENEFAAWEPVLAGIIDSQVINPAWKAGERQLANNYIANSQADIQRRTRQISQTLSETSDIISNSYWNRQATYDRLSEMRSNATLGVQNVASSSGEEYKVPYGYDRYWVDGLGNLYGGSWMSQPDINWKPLEPTGI
jgi:hypothetical protein